MKIVAKTPEDQRLLDQLESRRIPVIAAETPEDQRFLDQLASRPVIVDLPNGTRLSLKAPRNTDPEAFKRKVLDQYHKDAAAGLFDPTSQSSFENFLAGVGRGMTDVARNTGNILGMISDDDLREHEHTDKALRDTSAGYWGNITGQIAGLALAGGPLAGTLRFLAARLGIPVLGGATALGAGEGALGGYLTGDPDQRWQAAAIGTALGGAGAKVLSSLTNRFIRPVNSSPAAKTVYNETGQQVPFTHAPDSTVLRDTMNIILSNLPGPSSLVRGQRRAASTAWRNMVINPRALPAGSAGGNLNRHTDALAALGKIKPGPGADQEAQAILQSTWKDFFNRMPWNSMKVELPPEKGQELFSLMKKYPNMTGIHNRRGFPGFRSMSGQEFKDWRDGLQKIINNLNARKKSAHINHDDLVKAEELRAALMDLMEQGLKNNLSAARLNTAKTNAWNTLKLFQDYRKAVSGGAFETNLILKKAAESARAKGGDYDWGALKKLSEEQANSTTGKGLLTKAAQTGQDALAPFTNKGEIFQAAAAGGLLWSATAAALGGGLATYAAPALYAGLLAASTRPGTRFLAGNTALQKQLADALRKTPYSVRRQVRAKSGQAGAISFTQDD